MEYPERLPVSSHAIFDHPFFYSERDEFDFVRLFNFDDYAYDMHCHNFYELNIITGGEGMHYIEDQRISAQRGNIFVIPPNVHHGYRGTHLSVVHLLLHAHMFDIYGRQLRETPGFLGLFSVEPALRASGAPEGLFLRLNEVQLGELLDNLERLRQLEHIDLPSKYLLLTGLVLYSIGLLCQWYLPFRTDVSSKDRHYSLIIGSIEYIQQNYAGRLRLNELAQQCGLSRTAYLTLFRELYHCSPGSYILTYRLGHAKELLATTNSSVTEIALQCGFYDGSHLVRFFTRQEGISPRQFRLRHRADSERQSGSV